MVYCLDNLGIFWNLVHLLIFPAAWLLKEFAKSRAMRACVPTWSTCQRACVPTCQKRADFPFLRANMSACHTACQYVLTWSANVPNGVLIFQLGVLTYEKACNFSNISLWNAKRNLYTLLYKKFYILLDIIVINIICICIVNKTCIMLHFYTSCYIKEKCVEIFFLLYFSFLLFW